MKNKDKNLLDALGERYEVLEHDGGYCLYDKQRPAKRTNCKYIGKFHISSDKKQYAFGEKYYKDVESLVKEMDAYNAALPFDADIYCPIFKNSYRIEIALHDYLESLGFTMERGVGLSCYFLCHLGRNLLVVIISFMLNKYKKEETI